MSDEASALRDPRAFKQLEEKLYADKKWSELVSAYANRAQAVEDMDQRERLLFQAGQVAEKNLQDPAAAVDYYRRAFDVRRSFVRALSALRALETDRKEWKSVAETIDLELAATTDPAKKARLYKELGDALAQQEGIDPEEPIKAYGEALRLDPKQRTALTELERLCRKHNKWNKLVAVYKKLGDASTGKDAAVFHFLAGGVLDEKVKAPDLAQKAFKASLVAGPDDLRILGSLTSFFEKKKAWDDAVAALEAQVPLGENAKEKSKLLRRIGAICEKNLGDPDLARVHYRRAVDVRPDDAEALARVKALAEAKGDDAGLADALELEANNLELAPDEKADRFEKAAERREKAGDLEVAVVDLQALLQIKPRSPRALKSLERLTRKLGRWPDHARALELQAALLDPSRSPEERTATLRIERQLIEVREKHLADMKGALASLSRILSIDPDDQDALARVETLARKQKDWPRVAQALARRAEKTKDEAARAQISLELARVRDSELQDPKGSAEAWEDAVARDPSLAGEALPALRVLYARNRDAQGLARTIGRLVEKSSPDAAPEDRAELLFALGVVELERGDAVASTKAFREALALDPDGAVAVEARRRLVDAARKRGDAESLRRALAEVASRDPEAGPARGARLELARFEEKEQRPADALRVLEEQLAVAPADEEALPHAARLLAALGLPLEAAERLEVASRSLESEDPVRAASFARDEARILEREAQVRSPKRESARLAPSGESPTRPQAATPGDFLPPPPANLDPDSPVAFEVRARHAWQRVLELTPEDDTAGERLADLCRRTGDAAGLDQVLERACGRTAVPAARARLNRERALLARGPRNRPEESASLYERVLKDAPNDSDATASLLDLYRKLERWTDLADLLEAVAARDQTGPQVRLTDRLALPKLEPQKGTLTVPDARTALKDAAAVAAEKLNDLPRAVACLERLGEKDQDDEETLAVLASYLERLVRPRDLERVLARRAALSTDLGVTADLLLRRAHVLATDLGDHAEASKSFEKCLESRPFDRDALEGLARARHALGDLPGATKALASAAEAALAAGDAAGAAKLELARGDMARSRRDFVEAEAAYRSAVARSPSLDEAHDALVAVLTQRSDWPGLENALGTAALATESERRSTLLVQRADVLSSRLEKGEEALKALDEADLAAPKTPTVYDARSRVLRRLHRPLPLADALAARRALAAAAVQAARAAGGKGQATQAAAGLTGALGNTELVGLIREEAHLRAFELGDLEKARTLLDEARKLSPDDARVIGDLLKVERRAQTSISTEGGKASAPDSKRLLSLLERASELEKAPGRRSELLVEAGRTAKLKLLDPGRARSFFEAALAANQNGLEAVRWLQGLARESDDLEALAVWLAKEAQVEPDLKRRALAHAKLGDCERRRGRPDPARRSYEQALSDDPTLLSALRHLAPLLRRAKDWKGLAAMLEKLAKLEPDKHARAERLVMLGELRQRRLEDPKGARAAYDEALALEPWDIHALRGRAKTLDDKKDARELVATLETELKLTPSAARRADIHKRIGFLKQEHLADLEGAAKGFSAALRIRPDDEKARDALRYVHMAAKDWPKLARSYEDEARRATDRKVKEERFRQAALVRHHHLSEVEKAIVLYQEVLALGDPECIAIQTLPGLLQGPEREAERFHVLSRIAEIVPGSPEAQDALLELGAAAEKKNDRPGAQARYEQLLQKSPGHRRALDALVALHRSANDLPRLAEALDRKRQTLSGEDSARCRLDRGRVLEELRDLDAASLEYEEALKEDKDGREAISRLRSVYQRREKFPELVRTLSLAISRAGARAKESGSAAAAETEATKLLLEKATVEETRLKNPRAALESLRGAWGRASAPALSSDKPAAGGERAPEKAAEKAVTAALALRHEVADRWIELVRAEGLDDELAQVLARKAAIVPAGPARARVLAELARGLDKLGRHEQAIEAWDHALEQDPHDRAALGALAELCARTKDRRGHARALEREMELLAQQPQIPPADLERLVACGLEAARIHQELENAQAAVRVLERALDRAPDSRAVHEELARIHDARGHDAALYDALKRRAQVSTDRAEQARTRERMAKLAEKLGEDESAIRDWSEVLVRRPRDRQAMAALKRLHSAREEWPLAAEVSEREITVISELSARQTAPGGVPAEPPPGFTGAFKLPKILEGREPAEGRPGDLPVELSGDAPAAPEPQIESSSEGFATLLPDLGELHLALGELYERRLKKRPAAKQHYQLAHARTPSDPRPLRGLERLYQDDQEWENLSRARGALRDLEEDPQKRASLAVGIASAEERLGKRADAIAALKGALGDVPDNPNALALLRQHLVEATRWAEAADVLGREADVARERETILARRIELANLLLNRLDDPTRAQVELERARELDPSSADALSLLEKIYTASADRSRLARVLDDQARYAADEPAADLLAREGRVLDGTEGLGAVSKEAVSKEDLELAAGAYERALLRVPGRVEVLDALLELYSRLGQSKELARALHRRSELATGERARAGFERRAAEVEERELEDPTAAARTLGQLVARAATGPVEWDLDGALSELARLRATLGEHAAREQALARRTSLATSNDARRTLLLERARVLEERLTRPGAAAECVQQVLEVFPRDAALTDELARLREAAGDATGVVRALDHALSLASPDDAERRRTLHRKRAELASGLAYDPAKALESLRVLLELDPADDGSRESLEAILSREGRARELALHYADEVVRRRAKGDGAQSLAALERRRAELFRGPLSDTPAAEEAFRAALALDPDDARAREGLEALLRAEGHQEALAALLAENAARAPSDMVAAESLREEAQVHEQRGDRATAVLRLESALERTPDDRRTLRALVRLYRLEQRREDLARVLAVLVRALGSAPPAERSAVLLERGLVLKELGQPEGAEAVLEESLDLDLKSVPAARALVPLLIARAAWKEVARAYELESQAKVDRGRRVWLRCEIGRLRFEQLADPEGAARSYQEALALEPGSVSGLQGLARVLREHGRPAELATPLEKLAELAPSPEDRTAAHRELAHILEEKLGEPAAAAKRYAAVLADHPEDKDAVRGLARSLRALVAGNAQTKADPRSRQPLAEALGRELELEADVARRFALLSEVAALEETLAEESQQPEARRKRLEAAERAAGEACELRPQDADALAIFARVAEKLGKWKELAEATEALAGLVDDKQRAAWMLRRAGKLRAHRLADAQGAASAFEAAAIVDPRDREAFEALEPIARELRDHDRLLAALRGQLALAPDDVRRAIVALRLGEVHESSGDHPRAIEAYVLAREKGKAPQRKDAQKALDRCYRATERWTDLARVLEARAEAEPEARAPLLLERARVLDERLSRYDKAAEALREALKVAPDDQAAARWLERLLIQMARWDELAEFYEQESSRRGARGYEALVRLGRLLRDQLDDQERAAQALQKAVTLQPAGLEAIEALRDLYAKTESWPELLEVQRLEIGLVKEPRGREKCLVRAARVAEDKLGDLAQASRFFQEASQLSPNDRGHLAALARVQEARGDEEGLVRTLERDLALTRDPIEILGIRKHLGLVYAKRLFQRTKAIATYLAALEGSPEDDEALAALAELYRSGESWAELAAVLDRRAQRARGKEGLALRLELARVLAGKLDRSEDALRMAAAARAIDPRAIEATEIEVEVLRGRGGKEDLAEALARLASAKEDPHERATVLVELAKHLETTLARPDRALKALDEALNRDPTHEAALAQATRLQEGAERWDELFATYERAFQATEDKAARGPIRAKAAEVLERRKRDLARAERLYRDAIGDAPDHLPAVAGLARVLQALGVGRERPDDKRDEKGDKRALELARLEERTAELERAPDEKAKAFARAGDVHRAALGDLPLAQARYEAALALAPDLFAALAPLAEILFGAEQLDRALTLLERCAVAPELGNDPEHAAELLHALALAREKKGDREGAAAALRTALEHKAGHAQALEDLGRLLYEDGAYAAAVPVLEDLVARTRVPAVRATHELALAKALAKTAPDVSERALDLFKRGLEKQPEDQEAREVYGLLLKKRGQDQEAARELLKVEGAKEPARRARVLLALAELYEGSLQNTERAAQYLRAAIDVEGKHRGQAARRLAELHARLERWGDAVLVLGKAVELETDPRERAELYAKLGRLFRDRLRNLDMARRCLEKSLDLDPLDRHTLDSLARLLEGAGEFDALEQSFAKAAEALKAAKQGDEAAVRIRRADVLWRRLRKIKQAAKEYEAVLAIEPKHAGARSALVQLYLETGDAVALERLVWEFVRDDPLAVDHYRTLERAWSRAGKGDARGQALQALAVLAACERDERDAVVEATRAEAQARSGLASEDWPRLFPEEARGPVGELVTALAESFDRSVPDDLKNYGIGMLKRSLGLEGDAFPEHRLVKRVLDLLGIGEGELDLYWMADWKRPEAILAHAKRPSLILCPMVFQGLEPAEKAFVVARAVALVPAGLEAANALPARKLERLILAAAKAIDPEHGLTLSSDDDKEIRAFQARVLKQLTPELTSRLKPAATQVLATSDRLDVEGFRRAVALLASRAGVLAAGGVFPAAHAIAKTNVALHGRMPQTTAEVQKAFREFAELRGILEFSVSQGYLEVRRELGLARD